jgi:segregation and condensation protein A
MPYEVKLEVFEGPLDLLLHLITRQRVDIYDVSLSTITEEYLAALRRMEHLELEAATGFLVVAATLLELKSVRLLPGRDLDDPDVRLLEERDLLLARLVECATYREAGAWLSGRLAEGELLVGRSAALEAPFVDLAPDLLAGTTVDRLARAAAEALAPKPEFELDVSHVAPIRASVRNAILEVAGSLRTEGRASFERLCRDGLARIEVIVRFLALLELVKAGAVEIVQGDRFGDIVAAWSGEVSDQELLESVDEYSASTDAGGGAR